MCVRVCVCEKERACEFCMRVCVCVLRALCFVLCALCFVCGLRALCFVCFVCFVFFVFFVCVVVRVCMCVCVYLCVAASRGSGSADKTLSPTGTDMFIASSQFPCDGDRDARDDQLTPRLPLTVHTDASAAVTSCAAPTTYRRRNPPELVAPPLHRCQPRDGFEEEVGQRCEQKITWFLESIVGPSAHASNTSCE